MSTLTSESHEGTVIPPSSVKMPSHWRWARLDGLCEGIFDCPHSTPILTEAGPYIARSQDIRTGGFRLEKAGRVSPETYRGRVARAEPRFGDLLFSREGTYFGIAAEVPEGVQVCLGQRMVLIRPDARRVQFRFLRYWINSSAFSMHIAGYRDGSVAERLNMPTIRALPVPIAPPAEQCAIASILGALDDKIDLNRRTNETLEATTRALFKSWFVDFDPVHAKCEGRKPIVDAATAALFPNRFQASEIGAIPIGWRVSEIGAVAAVNAWTLSLQDDLSDIEYVEISNVSRGDVVATERHTLLSAPSRARRRLRHGDTVVSTVRPDRQSYFLCIDPAHNLVASTGFATLTPQEVPWSFLHNAVVRKENFEYLGQMADGGAYPAVRADIVSGLKLVVPEPQIADRFHLAAAPLHERAAHNRAESFTLITLRDALLPKLLSGQIRIKDAEKFIAESL